MSKFRGVLPHKDGGFVATISDGGKRKYLGYFRGFEEAKQARLAAEVEIFGAVFDRREIEILDGFAKIPLHGRRGVFYGWAVVDLGDVDHVKSIAWTLDPRGYVVGRPSGFKAPVTLHRWLMHDGVKGGAFTDHIDGDRLNNRRSNLRLCSPSQNAKNTRLAKNNSSGAKGVSLDVNGKWRARIWMDCKEIRLGTFETVEEARAAYDRAAIRLHGEFASPNVKQYAIEPGVSVQIEAIQQQ